MQPNKKTKPQKSKVKKPQQQPKPEIKPLIYKPVGKSVQRAQTARFELLNKNPTVQAPTPAAQTKKPIDQNAIQRKKYEAKLNKESSAKMKQYKLNKTTKRTYSTDSSLSSKFTQTIIPSIPEFTITKSSQKLHRAKYFTRTKKTVYSDYQANSKVQFKRRLQEKNISNNSIRLQFKDLNKQNLISTNKLNT